MRRVRDQSKIPALVKKLLTGPKVIVLNMKDPLRDLIASRLMSVFQLFYSSGSWLASHDQPGRYVWIFPSSVNRLTYSKLVFDGLVQEKQQLCLRFYLTLV